MSRKTHYEVLGVDALATGETIKKAYLVRSKMFHPDRFDPAKQSHEWELANDMLKELNEAYAVLRDPQARVAYTTSLRKIEAMPRAGRPVPVPRPERPVAESPLWAEPPAPKKTMGRGFLIGGLLALLGLALLLVKINSDFNLMARVPGLPSFLHLHFTPAPMDLPPSGEMRNLSDRPALAPFQIKAPPGSNFLVKLEDASSGNSGLTIFVRGGDTVKVHVPLGTYQVKYAFGGTWYGYKDLFAAETKYSRADLPFVFKADGAHTYTGYSLTLSKPAKGNLKASGIEPGEF